MSAPLKRTALVTGGAGFLGPHLIQALLAAGWKVASLDNYATGPRAHLAPFRSHPDFIEIEGSITDGAFVKKTFAEVQPEIVYHLAAHHFIPFCVAHPAETIDVNVLGTQRLIDAIAAFPVRHFVLASTADVYAISEDPHAETSLIGSNNIYGISKEFCERLLALGRKKYPGCRFTAARFFNLYGPGETSPHILPDIIAGLRKGNVLRLGNIEPRRDYIYVTDVAAAMLAVADYRGSEEVFNIGTGESRSVRQLIVLLEKVLGRPITVEVDPAKLRPSERQNLRAEISRAKAELGWAPRVGYEEGLKITLQAELGVALR